MMTSISILVAVALLGIGYVSGRIVGFRRIPHTIAAMSPEQVHDLGGQVQALRHQEQEPVP